MNKLILAIVSTFVLSACAYPYLTPPPPFIEEAYDFGTSHPFENDEPAPVCPIHEDPHHESIQWVE